MNRPFQLLIFDWDGTLADSEERIIMGMQAAIDELGLEAQTSDAIRNTIGLSLEKVIETLFPDINEKRCSLLIKAYRKNYVANSKQLTPLFDGVIDVLEQLFALDYHLAVATGKSRAGLDRSLRETQLDRYIHVSRCADESYSKPHPQMLMELLAIFDLMAEDALMIGDTEYDLQMANNAGMPSVGVSSGSHSEAHLWTFNPIAILPSVVELPEWLRKREKIGN